MFDQLPMELRLVVAYAPYDYALGLLVQEYQQKRGFVELREIAQAWVRDMLQDLASDALTLYGPTHPQAKAG